MPIALDCAGLQAVMGQRSGSRARRLCLRSIAPGRLRIVDIIETEENLSLSSERLLARAQSYKRARSPYLYGRDITGAVTISPQRSHRQPGLRMLRLIGAVRCFSHQ
jgi:hypothetical protein